MNNKKVSTLIVISLLATYSVGATYESHRQSVIKQATIEREETLRENMEKELSDARIESDTNKEKLAELESQVQEKTNALELARRSIELLNTRVEFDYNDVTKPSHATNIDMRRVLKGTKMYDIADAIVSAEEQYKNVNAFLLAGIIAQESSWGGSDRAVYDNNLTGYGVYNPASRGINPNSRYQSVMNTAKLLSRDYLTPGGEHYNGVSLIAVNEKYCYQKDMKTVDYRWTSGISSIANELVKKANSYKKER